MANDFLHDESGIEGVLQEMNPAIDMYITRVEELEKLVLGMESSSSWIDDKVKTSFINTAKSYISLYKQYHAALDALSVCLKTKSINIVENETNFS